MKLGEKSVRAARARRERRVSCRGFRKSAPTACCRRTGLIAPNANRRRPGFGGVHSPAMAKAKEARPVSWPRRARKASEFLYYSVLRFARGLFGLHTALRTPDRKVLDGVILPPLIADPDVRRVIFVGCDWYTRHYEDMFAGRDYWTIEVDPARARFGARQHIVGPMVEIGKRFPPGTVDLILCNGVIG